MTTDPVNAGSPSAPQTPVSELIAQRGKNREAVLALGLQPYGSRTEGIAHTIDARAKYDEAADKDQQANGKTPGFVDKRPTAKVAGRVMLLRDGGQLIWMNVRDITGDIQVAISQRDCDATSFGFAKLTDLGIDGSEQVGRGGCARCLECCLPASQL